MKVDEPDPVQIEINKIQLSNKKFKLDWATAKVWKLEEKKRQQKKVEKCQQAAEAIEANVERRYQQARQQVSSIRVALAHMRPVIKLPLREGSPK